MIEHLVQGATLDESEQVSAIGWLLGTAPPTIFDMTVQLETDRGRVPLTFVFKAISGRKRDEIEERHRNQMTGTLDRLSADCELVMTATLMLEDSTGRQIQLESDEFLTVQMPQPDGSVEPHKLASPAMALERRFSTQMGLVQGVASEILRVSGWDAERQGRAQRRLVKAALD